MKKFEKGKITETDSNIKISVQEGFLRVDGKNNSESVVDAQTEEQNLGIIGITDIN